MDHSSVHDSGDNTPSFFVQFESNSLKKKIIQSGNEHISIYTMQFEFTRPQHKQIKKKRFQLETRFYPSVQSPDNSLS